MVAQTERVQTADVDGNLAVRRVGYREVPVRDRDLSRSNGKATAEANKRVPDAAKAERMRKVAQQRAARIAADREVVYALRRQQLGDARTVVDLTFLRLSALRPGAINRTLNDNKVAGIATTLNWEGFVALAVQDNGDGTYTVLDGHHRFEAAQRVYRNSDLDPFVPCVVQKNRGTVSAAGVVHDINAERTAWTSNSLFWLRVDADDEVAKELVRVLGNFGLSPVSREVPATSGPRQGEVSGIVALEQCAHKAGLASAAHTAAVLKHAYGTDPAAYRVQMIRGVWDFLLRYADVREYRADVLTGALRSTTPGGLVDRMNELRRANKGKGEQEAMAEAIYEAYSSFEPRRHHPVLPSWTTEATTKATALRVAERAKAYRKRHGGAGEEK